jgi:hypothetical protein
MLDAIVAYEHLPMEVRASLNSCLLDLELNLLVVRTEFAEERWDHDDRDLFMRSDQAVTDLSQYLDLPPWRVRQRKAEVERVSNFMAP